MDGEFIDLEDYLIDYRKPYRVLKLIWFNFTNQNKEIC
ncbi:MAG: hypothetical protein ACJAUH_002377 [Saprospiraceae bacterium]|jgi:hypothetical protein